MATVRFVPPRVPLVDLRTGQITREWYLLFASLLQNSSRETGLPDPVDNQATGIYAMPDRRVEEAELAQAPYVNLVPIPVNCATRLDQFASMNVAEPYQDRHTRFDDLEMLVAGIAAQQGLSVVSASYVPIVTATGGVLTTYTASGSYLKIDSLVVVTVDIDIVANGTAFAFLNVTLPFPNTGSARYFGAGRERLSGSILQVGVDSGGNTAALISYDNSYPGGTGTLLSFTIAYST